jgi:hypothetical protein
MWDNDLMETLFDVPSFENSEKKCGKISFRYFGVTRGGHLWNQAQSVPAQACKTYLPLQYDESSSHCALTCVFLQSLERNTLEHRRKNPSSSRNDSKTF